MNKYEFFKTIMQLVFSVSIFALFVCYSSTISYIHSPQNSFDATCLLSMLEKKYMFLICNLILAFLANTTSSSSDYFDYFQSQFTNDFVVDIEDEHNKLQVKKKQEEFYEQLVSSEEEGSSENEAAIEEEEEEKESSENEAAIEEEEEEEELRDINTDELNRKFEEFIRKMKKEIMIEPKTHPIAI